jgi:hypothetical protein
VLFIAVSLMVAVLLSGAALAQTLTTAMTGLVSSTEDNAMEGVLVSAKSTDDFLEATWRNRRRDGPMSAFGQ